MVDMSEEMLELLDCPVCFNTIYPPIFQCSNGHAICASCKLVVQNTCPTCRSEMGEIRALILEKLVASMRMHCQYQIMGCKEIIQYESKLEHEEFCRFRPYNCPHPCDVKGDIPSLVTHMRNIHNSTLEVTCMIDTLCSHLDPYRGKPHSSNPSIYSYMGDYFCLHFETFYSPQDLVYMVFLTFMGEDFDAMNYRYSLEIGNDTRKMMWFGVPRSVRETREQIKESSDGMIIHQNVVQNFSESNSMEELTLRVKGCIWKDGGLSQINLPHRYNGSYSNPQDDLISRQFDRVLHV